MGKMPHNIIFAIIAVALVVSLSATLYSITQGSKIGSDFNMLTGAIVTKESTSSPNSRVSEVEAYANDGYAP
jgi:hypothetical protein